MYGSNGGFAAIIAIVILAYLFWVAVVVVGYVLKGAALSRMAALKAYAMERLAAIPDLQLIAGGQAPHILAVSLPGWPSQNIVNDLDAQGICISAGSACHRGRVSHVLSAMGLDKKTAAGAIRISFGPETHKSDIDALADALAEHQRTRFPML